MAKYSHVLNMGGEYVGIYYAVIRTLQYVVNTAKFLFRQNCNRGGTRGWLLSYLPASPALQGHPRSRLCAVRGFWGHRQTLPNTHILRSPLLPTLCGPELVLLAHPWSYTTPGVGHTTIQHN